NSSQFIILALWQVFRNKHFLNTARKFHFTVISLLFKLSFKEPLVFNGNRNDISKGGYKLQSRIIICFCAYATHERKRNRVFFVINRDHQIKALKCFRI